MANKLAIMLLSIDPDAPHLCGTPFFQAATAAAMDFEVEVFFASRAVRLLAKGVANRIYPSDNRAKSVYGFMQDAAELGVKFYACGGALDAYALKPDNMIPELAGIANATTFIGRVMDDEWRTVSY
ncbi:MAG: DsrE/DsrF/DrsH-like family protein [Burkholderiales bacterium]|nr:DsrE/DsrF/DrsH-like family protein [Burkholderiales bacterium]